MKTRIGLVIVFALITGGLARGALEFVGYIKSGAEPRFVIADAAEGRKSDWLALGQVFQGYTLTAFDPKSEVLSLENSRGVVRLQLKPSTVKDATASPAETAIDAVITEAGLYGNGNDDPDHHVLDNHGQKTHWIRGGNFAGAGKPVPIVKGTRFGYFADLSGLPPSAPVELTFRVTSPPMVHPDGQVSTSSQFNGTQTTTSEGKLSQVAVAFDFDENFELVAGKWKLEILSGSRVLVSREFETYFPK